MRRLLLAAIAVTVAAGCNNRLQLTTTSFGQPVGLTVAGTEKKRLFVANADEDTVQIINLPTRNDLTQINFVRGPNLYFPLRIPAGSRPTRLAASEDSRYVIVLDSASSSLMLLDADAFTKATDLAGNGIEIALTQRGATPTDMVSSTTPCPQDVPNQSCLARVYVSLAASGSVLVVDLKTTVDDANNVTAGPFFVPVRAYDVGGEPQRIALSWDGAYLYATDNLAPEVVRVGLGASTSIERRDIGGIGGPVAVARDNDVLLIGRPQSRDVVVMSGAHDATWTVFDANPLYAPQPRCLTNCATGLNVNASGIDEFGNDVFTACELPQPSDTDICVDKGGAGGIRPSGQPLYTAVYVDGAPSLIATLGAGGGHERLTYSCNDGDLDLDNDGQISDEEDSRDSSFSVQYGEYALVVIEGDRATGDVFWMPLKVSAGAPLTPQLASAACGRPALDVDAELVDNGATLDDFSLYQLANYLAPCVETPGRARFACAQDTGGGGVVVVSGNVPLLATQASGPLARQGRWDFTWEGVIPGLDRSNGGGEIIPTQAVDDNGVPRVDADNNPILEGITFTDVGLHTDDFQRVRAFNPGVPDRGIKPHAGDILEILSAPTGTPECLEALQQDRRICKFERRIFSVTESDDGQDRVRLGLDPANPLPLSCFLDGGRVAYRVRAGDQFLVNRANASIWRMGLGDRFGPGGDVANNESIIFQLREDLLTNRGDLDACERYDAAGKTLIANGQNPLLARDVRFAVIVTDSFRPYLTGRAYASSGSTLGSAGSLPGDILVYQPPGMTVATSDQPSVPFTPQVFITYSGADTLVGMNPTNADDASRGTPGTQVILRN